MEKLIEVLTMMKEECDKQPRSCRSCLFWIDRECLFDDAPCNWDIEVIKQALARLEAEWLKN